MPPEAPSQAAGEGAQEPVAETTQVSEAPAPQAPEQPPAPTPTPTTEPAPTGRDELERWRRTYQSQADSRVAQAQAEGNRRLAEMQQHLERLEQERITQLPDEDVAALYRQQFEQRQRDAQYGAIQAQREAIRRQEEIQAFRGRVYGLCPDEKTRGELEQREWRNEFGTPEEFLDAAKQYAVDAAVKKAGADHERALKALREAERKEATAEAAEITAPDLGSGVPVGSAEKVRTIEDNLKLGWTQAVKRNKGNK